MISDNFPYIAQSVNAAENTEISGEVYVGENCTLGEHVKLHANGNRLVIGDNTTIGSASRIWSDQQRTKIGSNVSIGENCDISASIGAKSQIGDNVTIKSTAVIGENCIIDSNETIENLQIPANSSYSDGKIQ